MSITQFFTLLGGVGLFLYGMTIMSSGLQNAAGDKVRTILEHATSNKIFGIILGITVTILIQSSSATDMMVIGFVNSGLMNLGEAIAVIMGANIGTTITAQITAFDLTAFAPFLLFIGAIMYLFVKKPSTKYIGMIILGFGMLFVGVGLIKDAIKPLAASPEFARFLSTLSNPFLAVLFGLAFTALLQSSSSSTVIFQAFAVQGILEYKTAVFLVIGAAIGSVTPNLLAGLTANRNGKRTSILNLCFNLIRAGILVLIITIFPGILRLIQSLSPNDVGRQIANTHTIFAITAVILIAPFSKYIIALVEKLIPELPEEARMKEGKKLLYMNNSNSMMPSIVIRQAMLECERMGNMALENLQAAIDCFFLKDKEVKDMSKDKNKDFKKIDYQKEEARLAEQVRTTESIVDYLCHAITDQLIHIRPDDMSDADAFRASKLATIATNYERISDHAMNIIEYMDRLEEQKESFSKPARKDMKRLAEATVRSVEISIEIFSKENFTLLPEAERNENIVDDLHAELTDKHINRMMKGKCDPTAGIVFTDMSTDLERCADNALNISTALVVKRHKKYN
ncbi:MAG: Na/Pi cotransporter family protein [Lachnospiraceae bacterium]|nr:Na/Pi cotransporter family protein [Lachnospiraceae bacterium]MBQ5430537.1 Na/Pi cotransporter family protein [Lachnospiraceae bacterium]